MMEFALSIYLTIKDTDYTLTFNPLEWKLKLRRYIGGFTLNVGPFEYMTFRYPAFFFEEDEATEKKRVVVPRDPSDTLN